MSKTASKRTVVRRTNSKITEAKLRKIIRDELARQHLVNEGFLDAIKAPFKKLSDKAKKFVAEKAEEILQKLKGATKSLGPVDEYQQFFTALQKEEGGMSLKELVASVPEYAELAKEASEVKAIDLSSMASAGASAPKTESVHLEQLRTSLILIEEGYLQRQSIVSKHVLSESVVAAVAAGWWSVVKGVVATCGLIGFAANTLAKICKYMGLEGAAKAIEKFHHLVEHVEEFFLDKIAFPKPVQYAAYRALWALKSGASKVRGKEKEGDALSFKQFTSPEGKEEREATLKAIHTAVIMILVVQAVSHIVESLIEFVHSVSESAKAALTAATHTGEKLGHAGVEVSNLAKAGRAAAAAAGETAGAKSIGGT